MAKVPRIRLKDDELQLIKNYRDEKVRHDALLKECNEKGIPFEDVNYYWYKSDKFSLNVRSPKVGIEEVLKEIFHEIQLCSPIYPKIQYPKHKSSHLMVIDPADVHLNKLAASVETGEDYNHNIAYKRVIDGVNGIIDKSSGFKVGKILLIIGNDILHVDGPANTTTKGTKQDVSMMWYEAFKLAQKLLTEVIELLVQVAPVHVQYDPSNHDYATGFYLAQTLEAWFFKHQEVTFNVSPNPRKYFAYFNNLIGTTHGDGIKDADLPMLMAHESEDWVHCKHRYFYTHHIHHKKSKDYMSVTVESVRSPSGPDSWHYKSAYAHAPKAIEAFIHHPDHGQVARISHILS
jgi:hypothetical protein